MMIAERIQAVLHALEVGTFSRRLALLPLGLAVLGLAVVYDVTSYRGFSAPEAMDAAQVARNLAEGRGFTTQFVRPFSAYLMQKHNHKVHLADGLATTNAVDWAQVNQPHPDLANAPVYPVLLAGLFKVWTPEWNVETSKPFWSTSGKFQRYKPEFVIAVINQILLLVVVVLTFSIARKLFDAPAAWLAGLLMLGADVLWRFSVSGQSTLLLMVMFLGLVLVLLKIEELGRAGVENINRLFLLAMGAGLLVGVGMLTRYAFGWLIVPTLVFIILFGGNHRRSGLTVAAVLTFVGVITPWIIRNLMVSDTWFGTAGYAVVEGTPNFPGTKLMQSVNPNLTGAYWLQPYLRKLLDNFRLIFQGDLLRVGGGWVMVLFLAGLLLGLRQAVARRLRYFTVMCLGVLIVVQALGQTQLSQVTPEVNSENLLVLLTPLMVIFAVAFFLTLLSQMNLPTPVLQLGVVVLLLGLCYQPLASSLLTSKSSPVAYPYYPPEIQKVASWMRPNELIMSDIPWAFAWYGNQQCTWTTINSQYEYFLLNDGIKHISGLYLTLNTLDQRLVSDCVQGGVDSWGNFVLKTVAINQIPAKFPLRSAPYGLRWGLFLTDRQRWETE
jgi:hypothetical protein